MEAGRTDEARTLARFAVEELPGNQPVIAWEAGLATGQASELDLRALILGLEPGAGPREEPQPEPEAGEPQPGDWASAQAPELKAP